jgi:hypothetical protein
VRYVALTVMLTVCGMATVHAGLPTKKAPAKVGLTREGALEVCLPRGERAYLDRLRCPDGSVPSYSRVGSVGRRINAKNPEEDEEASAQNLGGKRPEPGGPDFHTLDLYKVTCRDKTHEIYMDMYHCDQAPTQLAPPGFQLTR